MHVVTILRYYLGYTPKELSERAEVSFADLNEIENKPDYGLIGKYRKVAEALHVPVHTVVMNDILSVPETFFAEIPPAEYLSAPKSKNGVLGRQGEDAVWKQEQNRLAPINMSLSRLVIPCYKLRAAKGYDILSYQDDGTPMYIEVKTSEKDVAGMCQLTSHEYNTAMKITKEGFEYWIYHYSAWGTKNQSLEKINFQDILKEDWISPVRYLCDIKPRKETVNGFLHFRMQRGISQIECANMLEIPPSCLCKYETGENQCPVTVYQKMSKFYGVTVDALMQEYPAKSCG